MALFHAFRIVESDKEQYHESEVSNENFYFNLISLQASVQFTM